MAACAIRWFFFETFGTLSNDDAAYVGMAKHIFSGQPTIDGSNPHTLFPPGYPLILAIENLVFESFYEARRFEYVFLTAIIPVVSLAFFKPLDIKPSLPHVSLLCFMPFLLFFTATLGGATEIWFTIFALCGTYLILNFHFTQRIFFLLLGNCLFSFSYLIRPEGIAYFASSIAATFFLINSRAFTVDKNQIVKIVLSFMVPVSALILPYVLFLYDSTGQLAVSGKAAFNQELVASIYSSQTEKLIANTTGLVRVLVAPLFLGPIVLIFMVAFISGVFLRHLSFKKSYILLIAPIPIIFIALLNYLPWARSLIPTVPIFLIFAIKGFDFLRGQSKGTLSPSMLFGILTIAQLSYTLMPLALGKFDNNPKQYYKLAAELKIPSRPILVFSREGTLPLFIPNIAVCGHFEKCQTRLDYAFLSNSTHDKLSAMSAIENRNDPPSDFSYKENQCSLVKSNTNGLTWFAVYICS
jgi:hypothetical protein